MSVTRVVLFLALILVAASGSAQQVISSHPRLILDSSTLVTLVERASADTPQWQQLKAYCDQYIGGTVSYPDQATYPSPPDIGGGYIGDGYVPAVYAEGLCYRVMQQINPAAAAPYGDKVAEILDHISMPFPGPHGVDTCHEAGYGIRNYGVALGIGYDWAWDRLSPALREKVYTAANLWISTFEAPQGCAAFEYRHPQSNYYAGYFHAKAAIALATYDENPGAPAQWTDWLTNQFGLRVGPYYAEHLLGGGWPEGFGNYAPGSILNMSLPAREVKTATGIDLVDAPGAPYTYPVTSGEYVMHFTWPSRDYFDDRDTNRSSSGSQPPGTANTGMFVHILGAMGFWNSPNADVFRQYLDEVDAATNGYRDANPWQRFLFVDPDAVTAPIGTLPRSYFASGMGAVSARSDWSTSAAWMSFRAGPYVNNPGQGEEYPDQGSIALVRGDVPLLVNATGWIVHNPNGSAGEDAVYNDNYGGFNPNDVYSGNGQIYNAFYVRHMNGGVLAEPFGQGRFTAEDYPIGTRVSSYEDGVDYVNVLATNLEDMYRKFDAGPAVINWSRQILYLRPDRFIVYDRTAVGSSSYDRYLAFHFPASPTAVSAPAGQKRLDVTYNGHFAGAMTTVLPANAAIQTVPMYPGDNPTKVWQTQIRSQNNDVNQKWLTVFDLASSANAVATASPVEVTSGGVVGVRLTGGSGDAEVAILNAGAAGVPVIGDIAYTIPATAARHIVTGLVPGSTYAVDVSTANGEQHISISPGGSQTASAEGVLDLYVTAEGEVPPAGTLFLHGFDD